MIPVSSMKMAKTRPTSKRNIARPLLQPARNASLVVGLIQPAAFGPTVYTWQQLKDRFEDMAQVHIGEYADIHLAAYPNQVLKGQINNILPMIDPTIRTAGVRLEVEI